MSIKVASGSAACFDITAAPLEYFGHPGEPGDLDSRSFITYPSRIHGCLTISAEISSFAGLLGEVGVLVQVFDVIAGDAQVVLPLFV